MAFVKHNTTKNPTEIWPYWVIVEHQKSKHLFLIHNFRKRSHINCTSLKWLKNAIVIVLITVHKCFLTPRCEFLKRNAYSLTSLNVICWCCCCAGASSPKKVKVRICAKSLDSVVFFFFFFERNNFNTYSALVWSLWTASGLFLFMRYCLLMANISCTRGTVIMKAAATKAHPRLMVVQTWKY